MDKNHIGGPMAILGKWMFATTLTVLTAAAPAFADSAEQLLARDLRAAKQSFQQERRLYHYFDIYKEESEQVQNQLATPEGRKQIMWDRISFATKKFWGKPTNVGGLHAGEGLYLAVDPLISESYGKMLIEFKVKPSTFFIDLNRGVQLQSDTISAIYQQGYLEVDPSYGIPESFRLSEMTLNMILRPQNEKFRLLMQSALKQEGITLMEYHWRSDLEVICAQGSSQSAFVYIGMDSQMQEFQSVELADVKRIYPSLRLTKKEYDATVDSMKLIQVMKVNYDESSDSQRDNNTIKMLNGKKAAREVLDSLYGCAR